MDFDEILYAEFFSPPGKHPQFQQGRKGHKTKGHKAIKARGQNFPKYFLRILGMWVWIAPIFEGWSTHYHWSYVNCQLCMCLLHKSTNKPQKAPLFDQLEKIQNTIPH